MGGGGRKTDPGVHLHARSTKTEESENHAFFHQSWGERLIDLFNQARVSVIWYSSVKTATKSGRRTKARFVMLTFLVHLCLLCAVCIVREFVFTSALA